MATDSERGRAELRERRARLQALRRRAGSGRAAADGGASPVAGAGRAVAGDAADAAPLTGPAQRFLAGLSGESAGAGESGPDDDGPFTGPAQRFWAGLTGELEQSAGRPLATVGPPRGGVAGMLLNMLQSRTDPSTPTIPGTSFTEEGVAALLDRLQSYTESLGPWQGGLARLLHRFLTARPPQGEDLVAGVNVDNLRFLESFLRGARKPGPARQGRAMAQVTTPRNTDVETLQRNVADLTGTIKELTKRLDSLSAQTAVPLARDNTTTAVRARPSPKESPKRPAGMQEDAAEKELGQANAKAATKQLSRRPAAPRRTSK